METFCTFSNIGANEQRRRALNILHNAQKETTQTEQFHDH